MKSIPIARIRRDRDVQARAGLNPATVSEYAEALQSGATLPPVDVFHDGEIHWLADGFHRVAAAEQAGLTEVEADVRQGGRRDAILHACGANATHGLRRTNADKRRAVETLLRDEEWRRWSDRRIAETCGVSNNFVGDVRRELSSNDSSDEPETRIGADGKERRLPQRPGDASTGNPSNPVLDTKKLLYLLHEANALISGRSQRTFRLLVAVQTARIMREKYDG